MDYRQILNIEDLNRVLDEGCNEFVLIVGYLLRSRKYITKGGDNEYCVEHLIDGARETMTADELYNNSNIGKGMKVGAFLCEIDN